MILTTIAYDNQARLVYIEGPECCSSCGRSLTTRSPDRKETGVQPSTNAELNLYIYESDDDGHGGGLCEGCKTDEEQAPLWLMLAKWQRAERGRRVEITGFGVRMVLGDQAMWLDAPGGILSPVDVHAATTGSDRPMFVPRYDLLAGAAENYTKADSDADELAAATSFALSGKFDATPEDDCPKTERNDR